MNGVGVNDRCKENKTVKQFMKKWGKLFYEQNFIDILLFEQLMPPLRNHHYIDSRLYWWMIGKRLHTWVLMKSHSKLLSICCYSSLGREWFLHIQTSEGRVVELACRWFCIQRWRMDCCQKTRSNNQASFLFYKGTVSFLLIIKTKYLTRNRRQYLNFFSII
jgi:hypothetical protein